MITVFKEDTNDSEKDPGKHSEVTHRANKSDKEQTIKYDSLGPSLNY